MPIIPKQGAVGGAPRNSVSKALSKKDEGAAAAAGFSCLILLLSVIPTINNINIPVTGAVSPGGASPFGTSYNMYFKEAPFLAYVAHQQSETASADVQRFKKEEEEEEEKDADDNDEKNSNESGDVTEDPSSASDTDAGPATPNSGVVVENCTIIGKAAATALLRQQQQQQQPLLMCCEYAVLVKILSFMTLPDIAPCYAVCRGLAGIAQQIYARPSPSCAFISWASPPSTVPQQQPSAGAGAGADSAKAKPSSVPSWQCNGCSGTNQLTMEHCRQCGRRNEKVQRLFVGQLRKEATCEMVRWMLGTICPGLDIVHIESHTNPSDGRGKGCAWVFVANDRSATRLLALNKRIFMDISDEGLEGVWLSSPSEREWLAEFAKSQAYIPFRPTQLPRQPVVIERPKASAPSSPSSQLGSGARGSNRASRSGLYADVTYSTSEQFGHIHFDGCRADLNSNFHHCLQQHHYHNHYHRHHAGAAEGMHMQQLTVPPVGHHGLLQCQPMLLLGPANCSGGNYPAGVTGHSEQWTRYAHDPYSFSPLVAAPISGH